MIEPKEAYSFDDLLLVPKKGVLKTRSEADISTQILGAKLSVPILSANMPSVTESEMALAMSRAGGLGVIHRFGSIDLQVDFYRNSARETACAIGLKDGLERTNKLVTYGCRNFVLDVAHGDSQTVCEFVEEWKMRAHPDAKIAVGNVCTPGGVARLANIGADAIKVGIGPGAACTTREVTGFGMPQLTAINECAYAAKIFRVKLIADGGIRNSGDIVKALAAGADAVMVGRLFAGCDESPYPGEYWGNASLRMNGHNAPEGVSGKVEKTGPVSETMKKLAWGIRSGISYAGATNIKELQETAEWVKVTPQTMIESGTRL